MLVNIIEMNLKILQYSYLCIIIMNYLQNSGKEQGMEKIIDKDLLWNNIESSDVKIICKTISQISSIGFKNAGSVIEFIPKLKKMLSSSENVIVEKSLWAIGQIGHNEPNLVSDSIHGIYELLDHEDKKIRGNALWAIGRIGRTNIKIVLSNIERIFSCAEDPAPEVRMNFIWACENLAINKPELFKDYVEIFIILLSDENIKYVRREAPEIFRVIARRKPELIQSAIPKLEELLEDEDKVVRIHAAGALKYLKK